MAERITKLVMPICSVQGARSSKYIVQARFPGNKNHLGRCYSWCRFDFCRIWKTPGRSRNLHPRRCHRGKDQPFILVHAYGLFEQVDFDPAAGGNPCGAAVCGSTRLILTASSHSFGPPCPSDTVRLLGAIDLDNIEPFQLLPVSGLFKPVRCVI